MSKISRARRIAKIKMYRLAASVNLLITEMFVLPTL